MLYIYTYIYIILRRRRVFSKGKDLGTHLDSDEKMMGENCLSMAHGLGRPWMLPKWSHEAMVDVFFGWYFTPLNKKNPINGRGILSPYGFLGVLNIRGIGL